MHTINCVYANSINDYLSNSFRWIYVYHTTRDTTVLTCLQQPLLKNNHPFTILPDTTILTCLHQPLYNNNNQHLSTTLTDTTVLTCLQKPLYNNILLSTILPKTQLYVLPTETTLQQHPPVYHTTRDTTVFTCLQQPPYNNCNLSTILPETRLYLPAFSLTITSTCLPYYHRHKYTYLLIETTLQ